jgi:cell division septal protein FtsQ
MNRTLRRRLWVTGTASALGILSPIWGPALLRELPVFGVEETRIFGAHFVSSEEIEELAALDTSNSVWDDMRGVEEVVAAHPLVEDVRISRSGIHRLDIEVLEVEPIALAATPVLVPLDASGQIVPIDLSIQGVDLPVLLGGKVSETGRVEPEAARRALDVLAQLSAVNSGFTSRISSLRPLGNEAVEFVLLPESPVQRVILPFRDAVRAFLRVESAMGMDEIKSPVALADARFRGEVILRLGAKG